MDSQNVKRKLTAILNADVKYSRLMGEDDVATVQTLKDYRKIMASAIEAHHGRIVDSPGDNLLAEFASVLDATQCAVKIQQALDRQNARLINMNAKRSESFSGFLLHIKNPAPGKNCFWGPHR